MELINIDSIDDGANPGGGKEPYITHLYIEYIADKLGEAI